LAIINKIIRRRRDHHAGGAADLERLDLRPATSLQAIVLARAAGLRFDTELRNRASARAHIVFFSRDFGLVDAVSRAHQGRYLAISSSQRRAALRHLERQTALKPSMDALAQSVLKLQSLLPDAHHW
jgi:hypothetical protein